MRTLALSSLLLISGLTMFGQKPEPGEKAPRAVDAALRARITKFYDAFIAGKFKEAYMLVADDSQDKFFELDKTQYKSCEIKSITYSRHATKAEVVTNCKGEWRVQGFIFPVTFPVMSNWELVNKQWYWRYIRPTKVPSPFSPTGFVPVPPESEVNKDPNSAGLIPKDMGGTAKAILNRITLDKQVVHLHSYEDSQDTVHVRNDMPGSISLDVDKLNMPGLTIKIAKPDLQAREETNIVFEWRPDAPEVVCHECAKKTTGSPTVQLHILPLAKVFPIDIVFEAPPRAVPSSSPQTSPSPDK